MEYRDFYEKITSVFVKKESRIKALKAVNKVLTYVYYIGYPVFVLSVFLKKGISCYPYVLVPAIGFLLFSAVRKKINRPRPYEAEQITPLIHKDTEGKSFPSRHIFCASLISVIVLREYPVIGCALLCGSVIEACIRVIGGVHYPKDVFWGFVCGTVTGLICVLI